MREEKGMRPSRRDFIRGATAAAVGTAAAARFQGLVGAYAAGSDEIRVGLIGCGGRGTGAAANAIQAAEGVRLVAMADAFQDRLDASRGRLEKQFPDKAKVADDHCFVGLDAYKQLLEFDEVNYVLLTTPPGFRPLHIRAAIDAGKNIFAEKPIAVDPAGVRQCLAMVDEVTKKGLSFLAGTQYRHFDPYIQSMSRIHDGAIGELIGARGYYNTGELWHRGNKPEWSELEYQMRNWLYYTWLSGDHLVEQAVHNVDALNWAFNGHPIRAIGTGGRLVRTAPEYGHIYDHFAIVYEYPGDKFATMMCRQMNGTDKKVANEFSGSEGTAYVLPDYYITGKNEWRYTNPEPPNMYVQEHADAIAALRAGKPLNELQMVAETSLTAIMGRMSAYTGKTFTWEQALNSPESLFPDKLEWGPMPTPPVALPGITTD